MELKKFMKGSGTMVNRTEENKIKVTKDVIELFCKRMGYSEQMIEQHLDIPVTGKPYRFLDIDMVYLLFEIEKHFKIRIKEEDLLNYGLSSINQIVALVMSYLPRQE